MITQISGNILSTDENGAEISFLSCVMYCWIPRSDTLKANNNVTLYTYLSWSQENGPSLFGFLEKEEKMLFTLLISCSGIASKVALSILNKLDCSTIAHAILSKNIKLLTQVPGIGSKKAELIIFELKDKIEKHFSHLIIPASHTEIMCETMEALKQLGYSSNEISRVLKAITSEIPLSSICTIQDLLSRSLKKLSCS